MKQSILILGAVLCFQSYSFAAIGEADACQKETVSAAFQLAIEDLRYRIQKY